MSFDITLALLIGFGLDLCIGWPAALYAKIGHPVGWLAAPVARAERLLNGAERGPVWRFSAGSLVSVAAIAAAVVIWGLLSRWAAALPLAPLWLGLLFWPLIAARSMHEHIAAIRDPLQAGDMAGARRAVSMIVGRNPEALDSAGVSRAALESLAENTSDGIVAPMFWGLIFGPAGMAGYKAINTLDSMIAHRTPRYEWFGKTAARLDDLANLLPARLTGLIYALASGRRAGSALRVMWRDAGAHRSPNAGWPESALAGGLAVRLSGPRVYAGHVAQEPWLNGSARDPEAADLSEGLAIYRRLLAILALILVGLLALV